MTDAATLKALGKARDATAPLRRPGVQEAIDRLLAVRLQNSELAEQGQRLAEQIRAISARTATRDFGEIAKAFGVAANAQEWERQIQDIVSRSGVGSRAAGQIRESMAELYTPSPAWPDLSSSTIQAFQAIGRQGLEDLMGAASAQVGDELDVSDPQRISRADVLAALPTLRLMWALITAYLAVCGAEPLPPALAACVQLVFEGIGIAERYASDDPPDE